MGMILCSRHGPTIMTLCCDHLVSATVDGICLPRHVTCQFDKNGSAVISVNVCLGCAEELGLPRNDVILSWNEAEQIMKNPCLHGGCCSRCFDEAMKIPPPQD